jgi:hypothetical protein
MIISKWVIKAVVQKTISYLPWAYRINYLFQKHVTGGVSLTDEHFGLKLQHARDHYHSLQKYGRENPHRTILELGTGWYPVVPILFFLTSAGKVKSVDIRKWMTRNTMQTTLLKYLEWKERGLLDDMLPHMNQSKWEQLLDVVKNPSEYSMERINSMFGLTTLIGDARNLELEDDSVDFICSNNTFEHIPEEILRGILVEFSRVQKPGGMMNHFIDMSDHFAHFDHSITIYNFLKYSRKKWRIVDNNIQPQNRLRLRDYLDMYHDLGIPASELIPRKGSTEELGRVKVHSEFSAYSPEELAVSHTYIISCFE